MAALPSASLILKTLTAEAARISGREWGAIADDVVPHLKGLAEVAVATADALRRGRIEREDADFALHCQELYLANVLRHIRVLGYLRAQQILSSVFDTLAQAIAAATGVDLAFFEKA
ncbi:MAG: hypothetical protein SNJ79_02540 [Sphingomonadaceae bacterium]